MSDFSPLAFGKMMGILTNQYRESFSLFAALPHISVVVLFILIIKSGNRYRKAFSFYFLINYLWIFIFVGIWFSYKLYLSLGLSSLLIYGGTPFLLLIILNNWVSEIKSPKTDLDLGHVSQWRWFVAVPFMLWGFWYPPYEWGNQFFLHPRDLLFGAYGLMGCPTTLLILAILFLKYPNVNRSLYYSLTAYSVIVGFFMVLLRYLPDIPFFVMGIISLLLIIHNKVKLSGNTFSEE